MEWLRPKDKRGKEIEKDNVFVIEVPYYKSKLGLCCFFRQLNPEKVYSLFKTQ